MSSQEIVNLFTFVILIYMFCSVEAFPLSEKKEKMKLIFWVAIMILANVLLLLCSDVAMAEIALFTQTVPSMILCWNVSRHKDFRFLFVFCALDVIVFMLLIISNSLAVLFHLHDTGAAVMNVLFVIPMIALFYRYGQWFGEAMDQIRENWGLLSVFTLVIYGYSYFFLLYPIPWKKRPEYSPVVLGYAVLVLLSYGIIVKMVVGMSRIHDMEQEELEMKLKIETQNREIEEEKSRLLVNQIQPHFIYNVLMSIQYFIKTDSQTAYDMIYDFSQYLRSNVGALADNRYILWSEELEHIDAYVRIEKQRYKERLNIICEVEDEEFCLPPLTVELLVENAIKHGVSKKIEGGTV